LTNEDEAERFERLVKLLELLGPAYLLANAEHLANPDFNWEEDIAALIWEEFYELLPVVDANHDELIKRFQLPPIGEPQRDNVSPVVARIATDARCSICTTVYAAPCELPSYSWSSSRSIGRACGSPSVSANCYGQHPIGLHDDPTERHHHPDLPSLLSIGRRLSDFSQPASPAADMRTFPRLESHFDVCLWNILHDLPVWCLRDVLPFSSQFRV
jgi:hypothetical protein